MKNVALERLMSEILDMACPNGGVGEHQRPPEDCDTFYIETHCVTWKVSAKKTNGVWEVVRAIAESS